MPIDDNSFALGCLFTVKLLSLSELLKILRCPLHACPDCRGEENIEYNLFESKFRSPSGSSTIADIYIKKHQNTLIEMYKTYSISDFQDKIEYHKRQYTHHFKEEEDSIIQQVTLSVNDYFSTNDHLLSSRTMDDERSKKEKFKAFVVQDITNNIINLRNQIVRQSEE